MGDQDLPGVLVSDLEGPHGICEDHVEDLKRHFNLITMQDFLENKAQLGPKIQAVYIWGGRPAVSQELLCSLPSLKIVASAGAGLDHLDLGLVASFGVKVANTPHAVSSPTADLGMALLLAAARRVVEGHQLAVSPHTENFPTDYMGQEVTGATLGIIGMGSIGYKIAQRARAFEMKIVYHNRKRRKLEEEEAVGAIYCERLDDLLQRSDFVMLAVSLTPQTQGLIGKRELRLMKPTAILVNIGRGLLVDQDALVEALQTGLIKAAALDVTYPEPLPRHLLMSQQTLRNVPPIVFVQDKKYAAVMEIDRLLAIADFGPQDEKEDFVQSDFRCDPEALDVALPSDTVGSAAHFNLCGIDHEALNKQILEYKRRREQGHRSAGHLWPEHMADLMKQMRRRKAKPHVDDDLSPKNYLTSPWTTEGPPEERAPGYGWGSKKQSRN
ncbi:hypothetical protein G4228_016991 [Cervus hanglu yarkandensis]|nr:hypothetical protein G4228_016991 [Cervus hanglu yarkandensis]